jgi:endonuclease YncB( thermonuclease family)
MKLSVLAASLTLAALPAFAESVRVVDGDTLRVDGVTYRLWGIDAPESTQPCADGWPAGRAATEHLRALIGDRQVSPNPGLSIATAGPSRFAALMAET